ncbi:hypothetical protein [Bradyrhizobium brasilense]|uniref:Uncharacterized protein n=1 Tax=Bradyrhizobium brasilense TaxID=1419277 RepID=A0A1G7PVK2_9BRAD|nr:hypothetical protein [Bradyrhizobium brasilense]MCC8975716.1 hypothetical protein [Bradyrhizobium brasilense]SDF90281.1 hypothetical protein SAMN05216337_108514 [Bradyrhizobium brasilense]
MQRPPEFFQVSENARVREEAKLLRIRDHLDAMRAVLAANPKPDTFAGRKTQKPFPQEDGLIASFECPPQRWDFCLWPDVETAKG